MKRCSPIKCPILPENSLLSTMEVQHVSTQPFAQEYLAKNYSAPQLMASCPAYPSAQERQIEEERLDQISQLTKSFFRRPLPAHLISFTSKEGKELFKEALEEGTLENYFHLAGNFTTQTETAYCGLGSLAMVLNALEMDPGRTWKGVWRWYSDDMLSCCSPMELIKEKGITFDQFSCLAECHELLVQPQRYASEEEAYDRYRADLVRSSTEPGVHMVVSYARQTLGQTGVGHFSPIGGYHAASDRVLVLDVARFKYPSYWVDAKLLWDAMEPVDLDTGLSRGYHLLTKPSVPKLAK